MEINGIQYRFGKLDTLKQLQVARRLAPLLAETVKAASAGDGEDLFSSLAGPIATAFAKMSDEDVEYVFKTCLRVVERHQNDHWFTVVTPEGVNKYQDVIDLSVSLQLIVEVV